MSILLTRRAAGAAALAFSSTFASARAATSPKPAKLVAIVSDTFGQWVSRFSKEWTQTTDVPVEVISQAYDQTYAKVVTALAGGSSVDVVNVDSIWTSAFAKAGFIRPLTEQVKPFVDQYVPVAINQRKVGEEVYAIPGTNEGKFLYYNAELLKKGGYDAPPKTWEDLAAISLDLQAKGIVKHGIVWAWQQAEGLICDYTLLTAGLKGSIQDPDGTWRFQSGGGLDALRFMIAQLKNGIADPASITLNDRQVVDSFNGGSVAFLVGWSFVLGVANNPASSRVAGNIKIGLIPGFASAGTLSSSVTGGSGLGITRVCKSPDWAWDLIRFLTDPEHQVAMQPIRTNLPVWKALYNNSVIVQSFPALEQMAKQFEYAVWRPNLPNYAQVSSILQRQIHAALNERSDADQALNGALAQIKALG